ncbi:ubiquitin-conjugating enzyme E2 R1 isoform X1 [Molothrus ater]|uniref:ubiquitin-conjugating enzyme E2 R1 isoform X1 n=1 Tax=Molothrus ater TaxID=84834 RepID=UPI00174C6546|nr:ubiquitin-conjugating enzyme E2 R1 isoform X1 [Molothrus ater]
MGGKELLLLTAPLLSPLCVVRGSPMSLCSAHKAAWCRGSVPAGAQLALAEVPFPQTCQRLCDFHPSLLTSWCSHLLIAPSQARLRFPIDYPYSPPAFRFLTKMWHPNIYETGDVCISILHPPVDDPQSGELPSERWNPTQNVRTILLSVISLLNEPNTFSPANVDASVMYRKWKESKGKDREYTDIIRKQVLGTKVDAERDGVKVPTTLAEYCVKTKTPAPDEGSDLFYDDYYEDDEMEEEAESCYGDEDDSGNEES